MTFNNYYYMVIFFDLTFQAPAPISPTYKPSNSIPILTLIILRTPSLFSRTHLLKSQAHTLNFNPHPNDLRPTPKPYSPSVPTQAPPTTTPLTVGRWLAPSSKLSAVNRLTACSRIFLKTYLLRTRTSIKTSRSSRIVPGY